MKCNKNNGIISLYTTRIQSGKAQVHDVGGHAVEDQKQI